MLITEAMLTSFAIFLTYLKIFFSCAARVSFEYFPLKTFIINDVFEKNNRDKGV